MAELPQGLTMVNQRRVGHTVQMDVHLDAHALERALRHAAEAVAHTFRDVQRAINRIMGSDFIRDLAHKARQRREVYVAGLEGRYYVRGGMDTRYESRAAMSDLVARLMSGAELPGLTVQERAQVAAGFMVGWCQHQQKVCLVQCAYAMDVGLPEYAGLDNRPGGCGNCAHYL